MEIIKKNLLLVIVLSTVLLVSVVLIFFVFKKLRAMKESQVKLEELRAKIVELIEEKPAPLKENLEAINADTKKIEVKVKEIQLIFGKPYRKAIQKFAEILGTDEIILHENWNTFYQREIKKGDLPGQVFTRFLKGFEKDKVEQAKSVFETTARERSVETIPNSRMNLNTDDYIMEALGFPRLISPESCKDFMSDMRIGLIKFLISKETGDIVILAKETENFSFGDYGTKVPLPEDIPMIIKHWKLIEDLMFVLKESGIRRLNSIVKTNDLRGRENKDYLFLSYKIEIESPLESIKTFLNNLYGNFRNNRIYIIRDLTLKKSADEVSALVSTTVTADDSASTSQTGNSRLDKSPSADNKVAIYDGKVIMGLDRDVKAEIRLDYVIYIGDELKGSR